MFIVVPRAQAGLVRRAIAKLEGLPRRAVVLRDGVPDAALTSTLGSALDTTDAIEVGDDDGTTVCIELPASLEKYAGRTVSVAGKSITLPTLAELAADEASLPAALRELREARRTRAME